jgi:hypothetical protein
MLYKFRDSEGSIRSDWLRSVCLLPVFVSFLLSVLPV